MASHTPLPHAKPPRTQPPHAPKLRPQPASATEPIAGPSAPSGSDRRWLDRAWAGSGRGGGAGPVRGSSGECLTSPLIISPNLIRPRRCPSSCRSGWRPRCWAAASGRSGLTRRRSTRSRWPTPVRATRPGTRPQRERGTWRGAGGHGGKFGSGFGRKPPAVPAAHLAAGVVAVRARLGLTRGCLLRRAKRAQAREGWSGDPQACEDSQPRALEGSAGRQGQGPSHGPR